jgi:hypothetical protein
MKRLLWLCTHRTQWREEVPLLLQAGFEVIPVCKSHQLYPFEEQPGDPYYVQTWRQSCTLPKKTVRRIREVNWFYDAPPDSLRLVEKAFDGVIINSFLDTVLRFARWFPKPIFYRVFGRGADPCYTQFYGMATVQELHETNAYRQGLYHWCPILPTLSEPEHEILTHGEVLLEPFVSLDRLPARWHCEESQPYVSMVLSRILLVDYFMNLYRRISTAFCSNSAPVPLRILGQNPSGGGFLRDPHILGTLPDAEYFGTLAQSRVYFYEGTTKVHLHWSVWEAFGMGIPVVMLETSYPAWAIRQFAGPTAGGEFGIVRDFDEGRELLLQCLKDSSVACAIARRQQPLVKYITDRDAAVNQYRERLEAVVGPTNSDRYSNPIKRWARRMLSVR